MPLINFFISFLFLVTAAYGCGMTVHNEVTTRAMYFFNPTIQEYSKYANFLRKNPQFVQAGSFFPDWGYSCWKNDELSEIAHWPPFIKAATDHIREKYGSESWEQDEVAQGVISFLYAIVSHGIADGSFHSLGGIHDGFIATMAEVNFKQDIEAAHSAADMGGEFTLSHMVNLDYLEDEWQVPIDDIIEIYERINKTASKKHINYCIKQAFTAIQANKVSEKMPIIVLVIFRWSNNVSLFYRGLEKFFFQPMSPFLIEKLEEYYRGGINNMAADVHECWHNLSNWLEKGPKSDFLSLCDPFKESYQNSFINNHGLRNTSDFNEFFRIFSYELLNASGFTLNNYKDKHGITHYKIYQKPKDPWTFSSFFEEKLKDSVKFHQIFKDVISSPNDSPQLRIQISSSQRVNHHQLTSDYSIMNNRIDDSSWISKCQFMPTDPNLFVNLDLPYSYSLFGHDMVTGDFNGDGIEDLAISAPLYDEHTNVPHTGAVFILYGKSTLRPPLESTNILELSDQILYAIDPLPQSRFGWSLAVVDLNSDGIDDLAISAPSYGTNRFISGTGKVYVYFGHVERLSRQPDLEISIDAKPAKNDWKIEEMGHVLASGDIDNDGFKDLFIGCPYCGFHSSPKLKKRVLQTGRIFSFLSSRKHIGNKTIFDSDWSLHSPSGQNYEWFGAAIAVHHRRQTNNGVKSDTPIIIIGAPGYNNQLKTQWAGRVYGFEIRDDNKMTPLKIFDLSGTEEFQGIGSSIISGDFLDEVGDFLIITSQSETNIQRFPLYNKFWQAGAVRVVNMNYLKEGTLLSDDYMRVGNGLLSVLRGTESASHFGSAVYWDDAKNSLWISEPLTSWEAGHIYSYPLKSLLSSQDASNTETFKLAELCIKSKESRARFGSKIIKFDFNGDGKKDLVIASEHSSQSIRLGGSVAILLE
ncbi:25083_t:CDS:10 [Dentiscutata erythropus]|uniref:Phosphatidylinositol-glycan-specific phospholipase D n=1 Tax=Dentiscutata erythropus TaxID=1348616 RepID=A0A9N9F7Z7_9GLOM|nr:25083_t:CDS:10 [Dentiscutata erythropus]